MNFTKGIMLIKMGLDKKVIKQLYNVYTIYKKDKNFSLIKYIKMMMRMVKGEKIIKHDDTYIISTFMPPIPTRSFITNATAVENMNQVFTDQIKARRTAPISIYLCLTHQCPNNCLYCSSKNRNSGDDLSTDEWKTTIKDLQEMNTAIIGLTGGEPMMREDIYEIISAIDKRSTAILFTSGVNLTLEKAKRLKAAGLYSIGISLDSSEKSAHNHNRRDDKAFDYALKALQISRKAGLYTMAQTVILKNDLKEDKLLELFKLAKSYGAHEVKILEPILSGNLLNKKNLDKILYTEEDRRKLKAIQHRANKIKALPKITTFAYTESKEKFGCGAGSQHSYISADGHLYPCDFIPMSFGNVREENIKKLWKNMNNTMGNPKLKCFAQQVNPQVIQISKGKLPLRKDVSMAICKKYQSEEMPDYYKL